MTTGCRGSRGTGARIRSFSDVVSSYIRDYRDLAARELDFYRNRVSLRDAVDVAASCVGSDGKRQSHQRRLKANVLASAAAALQAALREIGQCKDFDQLMGLIQPKLRHIHPLGELTIYDVAHRIGVYLGLHPERVYLHRGTRDGAKALGFDGKQTSIDMRSLPREFFRLRPDEIEDCLCIYKSELASLAQGKSASVNASTVRGCAPTSL